MQAFSFLLIALAVLTCLTCTVLLYRGYLRSGVRLLFWSALCFAALSVNNLLLVVDKLVLPEADLDAPRLIAALIAVGLLLFGLVWEDD